MGEGPQRSNASQIPNHRVGVKVMSGASAGAITAAIGAIALADADQKPVEFDTHREGEHETYDFLQTRDLDPATKNGPDLSRTRGIPRGENGPQPVTSLLNSQLLDRIACAALDVKHVTDSPRPYISETLHIYTEPARRALFSSFRQRCREQRPTRA
jgi:hypothetical protein